MAEDRGGRYTATELIARWNIGDWGESCGPKPSGGSEPAATFEVSVDGSELNFRGPRTYRTTGCWEVMPGLRTTSHSATPTSIRTVCSMPPGDPREATITTTWTLRPDKLYLDEVGQYRFLLGGATCTASVRRTRVWTKIPEPPPQRTETAGATSAPRPVSPPSSARAAPLSSATDSSSTNSNSTNPTPTDSGATEECANPGPLARLVARTPTRVVVAGERTTLVASPRDGRGCALDLQPRFEVRSGQDLVASLVSAELTVAPSAPPGRIVIEALAEGHSVEFVVKVVSREEYAALLGEDSAPSTTASAFEPDARRTNVTIAPGAPKTPDAMPLSKAPWLLGGFGAALALAGGALLLRRRAPNPRIPTPPERPAQPETPPKICPVCGRHYPSAATFCGEDGALLVRVN